MKWPWSKKESLYAKVNIVVCFKVSNERELLPKLKENPNWGGCAYQLPHDNSFVVELLTSDYCGMLDVNSDLIGHEIRHCLRTALPKIFTDPHERG